MAPPVLQIILSIGVTIALWTVPRRVSAQRLHAAHRLALKIVLAGVIVMLIPQVRDYAALVVRTTRDSHALMTQQRKLSAADLEASLLHAKQFAPGSGLRCVRAVHDWDYVCTYMPTPGQSATRLDFGVAVD